jgi:hypothetical protein
MLVSNTPSQTNTPPPHQNQKKQYERFKPAYNYSLNPCGTVHITVGCGGKPGEPGSGLQALDHKYIEKGSFYCKDPAVLDVKPNIVQPLRCARVLKGAGALVFLGGGLVFVPFFLQTPNHNTKPTPHAPTSPTTKTKTNKQYSCHTYQPKLGGFCWNRQPDFSAYREPAYGSALLTLLNATHAEWRWNRNDNEAARGDDVVMLDRSTPKTCTNFNRRRRAALRR